MDYRQLGAEIALSAYAGMDDAAVAAALTVADIPTLGSADLMPSDFVARFTPAETVAVLDSTDAGVRALMLRLRTQLVPITLTGPTVTQGLAYLAARGLIAMGRVAEIAAVPAGPMVARCEQIGCGLMLDMDASSRALAVAHAREIAG